MTKIESLPDLTFGLYNRIYENGRKKEAGVCLAFTFWKAEADRFLISPLCSYMIPHPPDFARGNIVQNALFFFLHAYNFRDIANLFVDRRRTIWYAECVGAVFPAPEISRSPTPVFWLDYTFPPVKGCQKLAFCDLTGIFRHGIMRLYFYSPL